MQIRGIHNSRVQTMTLPTQATPPGAEAEPRFEGHRFRKFFVGSALAFNAVTGIAVAHDPTDPVALAAEAAALGYAAMGGYDMYQRKHPMRSAYPVVGGLRYLIENKPRHILQADLLQDDRNPDVGTPFPQHVFFSIKRAADNEEDLQPFGTILDVNKVGYEFYEPGQPVPRMKQAPRVHIGWRPEGLSDAELPNDGTYCTQPYDAALLNISGMSYGALSRPGILSLNRGARAAGSFHNTGEGGISPFHLGVDIDPEDPDFDMDQIIELARQTANQPIDNRGEKGGFARPPAHNLLDKLRRRWQGDTVGYKRFPSADIVWQLGTGYFGCRDENGNFDPEQFRRKATLPQVKMIEIKLSQGAKPGMGGELPGEKVTKGIAKLRNVPVGKTVLSPPTHTAFKTPLEMMAFIKELRALSGGKPVGFKLALVNRGYFMAIVKAMLETGIYPDFITIDGSEGGTGAAPKSASDAGAWPLKQAEPFIEDVLIGAGLRDKIRIIASGKIAQPQDVVFNMALGADIINLGRETMIAGGCNQVAECHKGTCPTGWATHDKALTRGLHPDNKAPGITSFIKVRISQVLTTIATMGLSHPSQINRDMVYRNINYADARSFEEIYREKHGDIQPGDFLSGKVPEQLKNDWERASAESFSRPPG